jgi:hypothetical protein
VQVANSALDKLDKYEGLDNRIACCPDADASVISLVKNTEGVSKVVFNLTLGLHSYFIFLSASFLVSSFISFFLVLRSFCLFLDSVTH